MADLVRLDKYGNAAVVTLDNPPVNVLTRAAVDALADALIRVEADEEAVAVVLTGAGERAFAAGADIKEMPGALGRPGVALEMARALHDLMNRLDHLPKPTIAALRGFAFGGGLELALACDVRIADSTAAFGLTEIRLGILPGAGGTQRLPRLIGEARAKQMMFTGEPVDAALAERWGLVNAVVEAGRALPAALELAQTIAARSLPALARIKAAVDGGADMPLPEALQLEARLFDEVFQTDDSREGITAFIEKRTARFRHR